MMTSPYRSVASRPFYPPHAAVEELRALTKKRRFNIIPVLLMVMTLLVVLTLSGCGSFFSTKNVGTALDIGKSLCIIANASLDDQTVKTVCNIESAEDTAFHAILGEHRKEAKRYAASKAACAPSSKEDLPTFLGDGGIVKAFDNKSNIYTAPDGGVR